MSKLSHETVVETVQQVVKLAKENKRKFVETIELQVALKNYDPNRDKRFTGTIRLPFQPKRKFNVCVLGNAQHVGDAKTAGVDAMSVEDLSKLNKNKKLVKKLANSYSAFLASSTLIRKIPRLLGPGLNKAGKFPSVLAPNDNVAGKCEEQACSVKFQLKSKKALCLGVAIGNLDLTEEQIVSNITLAVNFMVSLLTKNWQQVKKVYVKSTMGPSFPIYGF